MSYDIFISYRRDGGFDRAYSIFEKLKSSGYRVFMDTEELKSGPFDESLYRIIEEAKDVVLILTPGALDRCVQEEDWVRREIIHALTTGKNIIPVVSADFTFPASLPEPLQGLERYLRLDISPATFTASFGKLLSYLHAKPQTKRASRLITLVLLLVVLVCGGLYWYLGMRSFPASQTEKQTVESTLNFVGYTCGLIHNQHMEFRNALAEGKDYLNAPTRDNWQKFSDYCAFAQKNILELSGKAQPPPDALRQELKSTPLSISELEALGTIASDAGFVFEGLAVMPTLLGDNSALDGPMKHRYLKLLEDLDQTVLDAHYYSLCEFFLPVNDEALDQMRNRILPLFHLFPQGIPLRQSREDLKRYEDTLARKQEALMTDLARIEGKVSQNRNTFPEGMYWVEDNLRDAKEEEQLLALLGQQYVMASPATEGNARVKDKAEDVKEKEQQVWRLNASLEKELNAAREKFKPRPGDAPGLLWGKASRLMALGLKDEAEMLFAAYLNKTERQDKNARIYVAAAVAFMRQEENIGYPYGVLVCGFEKNADDPLLKVGDVIVAVNDEEVHGVEEFQAAVTVSRNSENGLAILRRNAGGEFRPLTVKRPVGSQRLALLSLGEKIK